MAALEGIHLNRGHIANPKRCLALPEVPCLFWRTRNYISDSAVTSVEQQTPNYNKSPMNTKEKSRVYHCILW